MSVSRRPIYQGRIIDFGVETITHPDGRQVEIEIARHPGGAAVVALDGESRICLIRQFRPTLAKWIWELPAGKIDAGEPPLSTVRRELEEEAGLRAAQWTPLGTTISCPGFSDEIIHLFLARELEEVPHNPEEDEYIERHWMPFKKAMQLARDGTIQDAKTLAALLRSAPLAGMA
ncbi:MAG: NUDIX hydrolase [Gammaproteobacteria bacterium]|nr:NUDIX hydrolase [Gammaproteobacteria bacterium]